MPSPASPAQLPRTYPAPITAPSARRDSPAPPGRPAELTPVLEIGGSAIRKITSTPPSKEETRELDVIFRLLKDPRLCPP